MPPIASIHWRDKWVYIWPRKHQVNSPNNRIRTNNKTIRLCQFSSGQSMAMVNVWYPKDAAPGIDFSLNVGHASLLLDRLAVPVYVSWWPQAPRTKTPTWKHDVKSEGGLPNVMLSFDDLDELAISQWWNGLAGSRTGAQGGYELVSYNCSTVVANALSVGGAEKIVAKPAVSMWTPARVEGWVEALVAKSKANTSGIFRHGGIGALVDSAARRMVSELGAGLLAK